MTDAPSLAPTPQPEGLKEAYWTAHSGEDYSVVMRPNETTDGASIRLGWRNPNLAAHIAVVLNAALRAHPQPGGELRAFKLDGPLDVRTGAGMWALDTLNAPVRPVARCLSEDDAKRLAALSAPPREEGGEPVAWRAALPDGGWTLHATKAEADYEASDRPASCLVHPLYAAPSPTEAKDAPLQAVSKLLAAARRVMQEEAPAYHDCLDNGLSQCAWCDLEDALAALTALEAAR